MLINIPLCKFSLVSFQLYTITKSYFRFFFHIRKAKAKKKATRKVAAFPAEPLRPCCDNCGKKIYVPVIKHLWSQNLVCVCVGSKPSLYLYIWTREGKQNKQPTDPLLLCVNFLHCFQGQPGVMGVEGQPGLAGYTVSFLSFVHICTYCVKTYIT